MIQSKKLNRKIKLYSNYKENNNKILKKLIKLSKLYNNLSKIIIIMIMIKINCKKVY